MGVDQEALFVEKDGDGFKIFKDCGLQLEIAVLLSIAKPLKTQYYHVDCLDHKM